MPGSYTITTFGCAMNERDSSAMRGLLEMEGWTAAEDPRTADLAIIETCAIRAKAEDKAFSALGILRKRAEARGRPLIVVAGCVAETDIERLLAAGASVILGPRRTDEIVEAVEKALSGGNPVVRTGEPDGTGPPVIASAVGGIIGLVTVMEGCSNRCSYCVVPSRRGDASSRPIKEIIGEVIAIEKASYKEVRLLGQNISFHGIDLGGSERLIHLLEALERETSIPRIRFATSHPAFIGDEFIRGFGDLERVMPHLHMPIQSGSDRVLAAMRRGYRVDDLRRIVSGIRESRPETSVTTDILSGFPTEREEDHAETLALLEEIRFDSAYVFAYSPRPGTPAAAISGGPTHAEARRRATEVLELQGGITAAKHRRLLGKTEEILIEGEAPKGGGLIGRTPRNLPVIIPAGSVRPGILIEARITRAGPHSLGGEVIR